MTDDQMSGFGDEPSASQPQGGSTTGAADPPKTTAVAAPSGGALQVVDFGEDAGGGLEGMRIEEQLTPFLRIIQKGSPQVDPAMPTYDPNLRAGMILNTATGEAYDGARGVEVVAAWRDYHYGMWVPRDAGGGFRGMLPPEAEAVRRGISRLGRFKKIPHVTPDNEAVELVETIQLGVLYAEHDISEANVDRAIIAFTSTGMPVAQQFLTRSSKWKYALPDGRVSAAPLWAYRWRFSLVPQQNKSGSWFNWKIDLLPDGAKPIEALLRPDHPLYRLGKEFNELFRGGEIKADYSSAAGADDDAPPF